MDNNFTPNLRPKSNIGAFRFWCQKVLPLVYDDSLSYYELLNKVVHYLNSVIAGLANTDDNVIELVNSFEQLKNWVENYFKSTDFQYYVNTKLDEMTDNGTLSEIINNSFNKYTANLNIYVPKCDSMQNIAAVNMGATNILVDCGRVESAQSNAEQLKANGYNKFDYVIITHYHEDHAEGLSALVDNGINFQNAVFILPPVPNFNYVTARVQSAYNEVERIIQNVGGSKILGYVEGQRISVDDVMGFFIELYNVEQSSYYTDDFDYNNCSMVIITGTPNATVCWTGDISIAAQERISSMLPHCDMMATEHHCLNSWVYMPYILKVSPAYCITMNGYGNANYDTLRILTHSKTQSVLQRLNIPNYCTSDNGDMHFVLNKTIKTDAKVFNGRVNYFGATSVLNAINYQFDGITNDITLFDLIKGMPHGSYVHTKVTRDSAIFRAFEELMDGDFSSVSFLMYKNSSAEYTAESNYVEGFILITPITSNKNASLIYATYQTDNNYSSINITFKPLSPNFPFKFNLSESGTFTATNKTDADIISASGGEITTHLYGYLDYTVVIENAENAGTVYFRKNGSNMSSATVNAGGYLILRNCVECKSGDVFTIENSGGGTLQGRVIGNIINRYVSSVNFTDTTTTAKVFFNEYPTY